MCNSKILPIFFVLITVFFETSNAYISILDSNLKDGQIFMGVGGILFLISIFICQTLLILCGKNRKGGKNNTKKNTETDMEIATDPIDQKLFKSVEERKAKRRTERRRKVLACEAPIGSSGSAVKRGDNFNVNDKSEVEDDEEEESPPEKEVVTAAAVVARKKKKNATKTAEDPLRPRMTEQEDGYARMTPMNWQK